MLQIFTTKRLQIPKKCTSVTTKRNAWLKEEKKRITNATTVILVTLDRERVHFLNKGNRHNVNRIRIDIFLILQELKSHLATNTNNNAPDTSSIRTVFPMPPLFTPFIKHHRFRTEFILTRCGLLHLLARTLFLLLHHHHLHHHDNNFTMVIWFSNIK